jgi:ADP-ribosylglycohydrolase
MTFRWRRPLFDPHCHFTDDSVLTVAAAQAILEQRTYLQAIRELGQQHPHAGYVSAFRVWLFSDHPQPYNSWGNGSATRVSQVAVGLILAV